MSDKQRLICSVCRGSAFDREQGRIDSRFGFTSHKVNILICKQCRFVMLFGEGRSIFDFD